MEWKQNGKTVVLNRTISHQNFSFFLIFQEIVFVCVQECGFDSRVPPLKQMQLFEGFECANREAAYIGSRLAHLRKVKLNKFGGP
jgi:hypothetical protein